MAGNPPPRPYTTLDRLVVAASREAVHYRPPSTPRARSSDDLYILEDMEARPPLRRLGPAVRRRRAAIVALMTGASQGDSAPLSATSRSAAGRTRKRGTPVGVPLLSSSRQRL